MPMRRLALSFGIFLAASTGPAFASAEGLYVSGMGGVSYLPSLQLKDGTARSTDSFKLGHTFGTALGYHNGNGWRYELDWVYQKSDIDRFNGLPESGHIWSMELMANVVYDLTQGSSLTPYVGAGVGVQLIGGEVHAYSGSQWRPSYQLRAGMHYDLAADTALFAEYRFTRSQTVSLAGSASTAHQHFAGHALMIGVTFRSDRDAQNYLHRAVNVLGIASFVQGGDS